MCTATKSPLTIGLSLPLGFAMTLLMWLPQATASERGPVTNQVDLPPAQEAYCRKVAPSGGIPHGECLKARGILAVMSAERRDSVWADKIESTLQKWAKSLDSSEFTFRNVECRLSLCVVEIGSTVGAGYGGEGHSLVMAEQHKNKIFHFMALFAPDLDDPNAWDVLIFVKRYCKSPKELFDPNDYGHLARDFYTQGQKC